ncbi:MAG: hypothetical protein QG635_1570, partial [Bacteroidota bacterium]|nr:hypothetical protein [Bacteroidota bacterium]
RAQLFDALGAEVSPLVTKFIEPGGTLIFDIDKGLAAGVYFLRIEAAGRVENLKVAVY